MMSKKSQYCFEDFTLKNYNFLLEEAKNYYDFRLFPETLEEIKQITSPTIFLRHDMDLSPYYCLKSAEIEQSLGIRSVYFILLHSEFYNVYESESRAYISKILELGHEIGVHFDYGFYDFSGMKDFEWYLSFEKEQIETLFDTSVRSFSFHNPTDEALKLTDYRYADMINVYNKDFKSMFSYCSDSNGYWRFERLADVLTQIQPRLLQVLTHPGWWQEEVLSPYERILNCVNMRKQQTLDMYNHILAKYGRLNIKNG